MFIKLKKCYFCRRELPFLGHLITDQGVKPDPAKLQAIETIQPPKNVKDLRAFLGLTGYYRRFIKDYAAIAKPLTNLTGSKVSWNWTIECQEAFVTLKRKLLTDPILAFPNFNRPFILHTDASDFAIGAVLSQKDDNGIDRVISYASRKLNPAERNYSATARECLAVVHWTKYYRPYLFGTKFTVVTDHVSLKWLFNFKQPNP